MVLSTSDARELKDFHPLLSALEHERIRGRLRIHYDSLQRSLRIPSRFRDLDHYLAEAERWHLTRFAHTECYGELVFHVELQPAAFVVWPLIVLAAGGEHHPSVARVEATWLALFSDMARFEGGQVFSEYVHEARRKGCVVREVVNGESTLAISG